MRSPAMRSALIIAGSLLCGCSFILDPERIDDLPRCEFESQCPEHEDRRFVNVCTTTQPEADAPKICAPRPDVSCDPFDYDAISLFASRHRQARADENRYEMHCGDLGGVQGCLPGLGECDEGLRPHPRTGRCDDQDDDTLPALAPQPSVAGQDVLDQFCRSTFCSQDFVCHKGEFKCVRCELGEAIGRGGCGELYPGGERSSVYTSVDQLEDDCLGDDADEDTVTIGPVETPPQIE